MIVASEGGVILPSALFIFLLMCAALLLGFCSSRLAFFLFSCFLCFAAVFLPAALSSLDYHHHIYFILVLRMAINVVLLVFLYCIMLFHYECNIDDYGGLQPTNFIIMISCRVMLIILLFLLL